MPKGINISPETRTFIHQLFMEEHLTAEQIFLRRYRNDGRAISLKRLKDLGKMFNNRDRAEETAIYLGAYRNRGNQGNLAGTAEIDICVQRLLDKWPHATLNFYRYQLTVIRGFEAVEYSKKALLDSIWRCKGTRKMTSFFSGLQNSLRIEAHMNTMMATPIDNIVCLDETSCSTEKRRQRYGRGLGPVIIREWEINGATYSAMAAMTTRGFHLHPLITEGSFTHVDVENFVTALATVLGPNDLLLFDNASIHVVESTLTVIDRVFNQNWKRNVEYCPHLNPIEKGFSLVWNYIRRRWIEAQRQPRQVLQDAFEYYSIGGPGGNICRGLFNVYARNRA